MTTKAEVAIAILASFGAVGLLSLMGAYLIIGMAWDRSPLRAADADANPRLSGWTLTARALALRCPKWGRGQIFGARFHMNEACPVCGVIFWKNEGEWLGPAVVDYTVATASGLVAWAILVLIGAFASLQLVFASLGAVLIALALSRWSRSLWTLVLYISGDLGETSYRVDKQLR